MPIYDDRRPTRDRLRDRVSSDETASAPQRLENPNAKERQRRPGAIDPNDAKPGPFHMLGSAPPDLVGPLAKWVNEHSGEIIYLWNEVQLSVSRYFGRNAKLTADFLTERKTDPESEEGKKLVKYAQQNDRMVIFFVLLACADQAARCMPKEDLAAFLALANTFVDRISKLEREGKVCPKHGAVMRQRHEKTKIHVCPFCEEHAQRAALAGGVEALKDAIGIAKIEGELTPEKIQGAIEKLIAKMGGANGVPAPAPETPPGGGDGPSPA